MDHLFAMTLTVLGVIGFLLWIFRPQASRWVRVLISIPAIGWLVVYFFVELGRAEPAVWTGRAEMHLFTVLIIAAGVYVLVGGPKRKDGGERSA